MIPAQIVTQRVVIVSRTRRCSSRGAASSLEASAAARRPNPSGGLRRAKAVSSHRRDAGLFTSGVTRYVGMPKRILSPLRSRLRGRADGRADGRDRLGEVDGRARCSSERGAVVVDADRIAREVVEPGTPTLGQARRAVRARDPRSPTGRSTGRRSRPARSSTTRPARSSRRSRTRRSARSSCGGSRRRRPTRIVVHDVPLLVESKRGFEYGAVIVVEAPLELRLDRLEARGVPRDDARAADRAAGDRRGAPRGRHVGRRQRGRPRRTSRRRSPRSGPSSKPRRGRPTERAGPAPTRIRTT